MSTHSDRFGGLVDRLGGLLSSPAGLVLFLLWCSLATGLSLGMEPSPYAVDELFPAVQTILEGRYPPADTQAVYPLLVAAFRFTGGDRGMPVLLTALSLLYGFGAWFLLRTLFSQYPSAHCRTATVLALPVFVLSPPYLQSIASMSRQGPAMALVMIAVALLVRAEQQRNAPDALKSGMYLALASYFDISWLLAPALLLLWFLIIGKGSRAVGAAMAMLAMLVMQLPLLVVNQAGSDHWTLLERPAGQRLFKGNFPPVIREAGSYERFHASPKLFVARFNREERARYRELSALYAVADSHPEADSDLLAAVVRDMRSHPGQYLRTLPLKFRELVLTVPGTDRAYRHADSAAFWWWKVYNGLHVLLLALFFFTHWSFRTEVATSLFIGLFYLLAGQSVAFEATSRQVMAVMPLIYWVAMVGIYRVATAKKAEEGSEGAH